MNGLENNVSEIYFIAIAGFVSGFLTCLGFFRTRSLILKKRFDEKIKNFEIERLHNQDEAKNKIEKLAGKNNFDSLSEYVDVVLSNYTLPKN